MEIFDYKDIKNKLKMYYKNIDVNLSHNGWYEIRTTDLDKGDKAIDIASKIIKAHGIEASKYCYRKRKDTWGLPLLTVYYFNK